MPFVLLTIAYLRQKYTVTIVSTLLLIMLKTASVSMCGLVSTSFFFVAMAVTDGIAQFLTRENLLLNSVHRKIQADPKENFRDEFRGENSLQKSRENQTLAVLLRMLYQ